MEVVVEDEVEVEVEVEVVATTTTVTTTTTLIIIAMVVGYQKRLISNTSFIVGPMESIHLTTVAVAPQNSRATKMLRSIPIKWADDKQILHDGMDLSFPESLGGVRAK